MSQMFPHFYCSDCSNVIFRESDRRLVLENAGAEVLQVIASSLPDCECGGKFVAGTDPKCPTCHYVFRNRFAPPERLTEPNIILIDGAVLYGDDGPKYRVRIVPAS